MLIEKVSSHDIAFDANSDSVGYLSELCVDGGLPSPFSVLSSPSLSLESAINSRNSDTFSSPLSVNLDQHHKLGIRRYYRTL